MYEMAAHRPAFKAFVRFFHAALYLNQCFASQYRIDLAAAETTSAASHAAAAAASNVQAGRLGGRYGFVDERTTQPNSEEASDGAVVLGNPVAPPANGDMYTDISTENAMLQRYALNTLITHSSYLL